MAEDLKCPKCKGAGGSTSFGGTWNQCPNCKGTGVIRRP